MPEPEQNSEYIRKDVFDARMDRLEALLGKVLIEIKADNEKLHSRIDSLEERLRNEIRSGDERLHNEVRSLRKEMEARFVSANERMDRHYIKLDGKIDVLSEHIDKNYAQHEAKVNKIEGDIKVLNVKLDLLEHRRYWDIAWFGIAVAAVVAILQYLPR